MPLAWQTLWPTAEHSCEAEMNPSLMTVEFMFLAFTEMGVSSTDGTCLLDWESSVVAFTSDDGGVSPARM